MSPPYLTLFMLVLLAPTGCGTSFWLPDAHKIDIQQGNLISQEQIDQLRIGMSRQEVRVLLGEPVLGDVFDQDRWDYVYTRGLAGEHVKATNLIIHFKNDKVTVIDNNYHYSSDKS